MNVINVRAAVDHAKALERDRYDAERLKDEAVSLGICPDCGNAMHVVSGKLFRVIRSRDIVQCDLCGKQHVRFYQDCLEGFGG